MRISAISVQQYNNRPRARFAAVVKRRKPTTVPEWKLQAAGVAALKVKIDNLGWPITYAADMNAGKRSLKQGAKAKLTGMMAGEPDVRIYGDSGRLLLIEYKAEKGRVSDAQRDRHALLRSLGHPVSVIKANSEVNAAAATIDLVGKWLAKPTVH